MNLKYYLRGLGIGLIMTTIILTVSNNVGSASDKNSAVGPQSQQEPTSGSGSVIAFDRQQTTEASSENVTESVTEPVTNKTEQSTTIADLPTTQEAVAASQSAATAAPSDNSEVTVVIKNVYYGTQAADILYDAGLITDKSDFVQYLISSGYGTKIQEGVYSIPKGSDYKFICQTISRK